MTVAISCNLSDGVILGVDSAVTVPGPSGIAKVYENAEKLFQLGTRPIGVATFGLGGFVSRSVGSFMREFEVVNKNNVLTDPTNLSDVVEALREFFMNIYQKTVVPAIEEETKKKFDEIPVQNQPALGLILGGFSANEYLSEVWETIIPRDSTPGSANCKRSKGDFGTNWFAMYEPVRRYFKGYDMDLLNKLVAYFEKVRGSPLTANEKQDIEKMVGEAQYQVPYGAMPIEEGVQHTRFLVDLVINHHRYVVGAEVVGGRTKIGKVTYKGEQFQISD